MSPIPDAKTPQHFVLLLILLSDLLVCLLLILSLLFRTCLSCCYLKTFFPFLEAFSVPPFVFFFVLLFVFFSFCFCSSLSPITPCIGLLFGIVKFTLFLLFICSYLNCLFHFFLICANVFLVGCSDSISHSVGPSVGRSVTHSFECHFDHE